jgi:hypothetical protein
MNFLNKEQQLEKKLEELYSSISYIYIEACRIEGEVERMENLPFLFTNKHLKMKHDVAEMNKVRNLLKEYRDSILNLKNNL